MKVTAGRMDIRDACGGGGNGEKSLFPIILRTYNQVREREIEMKMEMEIGIFNFFFFFFLSSLLGVKC